jgi:transcriptional regulator with XRE-family HTH domain
MRKPPPCVNHAHIIRQCSKRYATSIDMVRHPNVFAWLTLFGTSIILPPVKPKAVDEFLYRQFGQLLAEIRRKKGMSQELLADELGLSRTSITNIEKGRQPIQLHSLYRIARLLGVELKELLPSPKVLELARSGEKLSVSRSEWLENMNVKLPKGLLNAPDRHRTRSPKAT